MEHAGRVYRPLDPHEHFPYYAVSRAQVERGNRPLGADAGWRSDPMGPATATEAERAITFTCEGPGAEEAMTAIKDVAALEPGGVFGIGHTLAGVLESIPGVAAVSARAWRPEGYRFDPARTAKAAIFGATARPGRERPSPPRPEPYAGHVWRRLEEERRALMAGYETTGGWHWTP